MRSMISQYPSIINNQQSTISNQKLELNKINNIMRKVQLTILAVTFPMSYALSDGNHSAGLTSIDMALSQIESNNTTLMSYRKDMNVSQLENKADTYPEDPEIGFNLLWGSPSEIGSRKDISVSQPIDIPTVTGKKRELARRKDETNESEYRIERMNVLLEAKLYLIELIYTNAMLKELYKRKEHAATIKELMNKRLEKGDGNILDYNNSCLNVTNIEGDIRKMESEKEMIVGNLARLNGGKDIEIADTEYPEVLLPTDFEKWYAESGQDNPLLNYEKSRIRLGHSQLDMAKSLNLPKFSVGYMSEKTVGERFQGVTIGVTVPLWGNKNRTRIAKANIEAAEARKEDVESGLRSRQKTLFRQAKGLLSTALTYESAIHTPDNERILKKALDYGEITIIEYMTQAAYYYDSYDKAMAARRDYMKTVAELNAYQL